MDSQKQCGRRNFMLSDSGSPEDGHSACQRASFKSFSTKASGVAIYLNKHGEEFFRTFLASRLKNCFVIFRDGLKGKQAILGDDPKSLAESACMSSKAMVKILKKCNKVHGSKNGQKSWTQILQNLQLEVEDMKPPSLCELIAFHINVEEKRKKSTLSGLLDECKLQISDGRCSLSISRSNSRDIDVDLTCSICLDTVFDPVSLCCGHIFCYMCACSAGSVTTIDGIKAADSTSKCPLCRKEGVFRGAERMSQLHQLLKTKLPEYWEERREKERQARMKEAKQYWELQCRAFLGVR